MDNFAEQIERRKEKLIHQQVGLQFKRKGFKRSLYILNAVNGKKVKLLEILEGKRTFWREVSIKQFLKEFSLNDSSKTQ